MKYCQCWTFNLTQLSDAKSCQCFYIFISSDLFTYPVLSHVFQWICLKWIGLQFRNNNKGFCVILCICMHIWCNTLTFMSMPRSRKTDCTVFLSVCSVQSDVAWGDSRQSSRLQQPTQTQCSTVETVDLPVCTTEVYTQCKLQPFTEAFTRSQWCSPQCIKCVFVFSWHWSQCSYRFIELEKETKMAA